MGTIQVPGRLSGRTYTLTIKGDTPSETEQARIRDFVGERETKFVQRYESTMGKPLAEPDDGTALSRGLERGKAGAKSVLGTTVETIGQQVGLPSIAEYGRGMEEAAAKRQLDLSLLQPPATTRQDVAAAEGFFPTIGKSLTYAGELAGEQIPQLGVGLAGGAAGAVAGGLAAGPPGALTGFGVGSGLVEAPMLFGANVQRQEEEVAAGRKKAVDLTDALTATVGQAALTSAANALAGAGVFLRPGAKLFTRAVSGAATGATTESLNEVGQQLLERYQAGLPVDSPDAIQEYIDAGIAGGVLGGGAGGIGGAVGGSRPVEPAPVPPVVPPAAVVPPVPPTVVAPTVKEAVVPPTVKEAVVPPTVEEAQRVPSPFTVKSGPVSVPITERAAVVAPPRPPRFSESDDFDMAETLAKEDRAAAETKPAQLEQVLTDDLVTQLGIRNAKSAPLRTLVGKPLTDTKVIGALNSWAQNERSTPEQKTLAASLSTGQPIAPVEAPVEVVEPAAVPTPREIADERNITEEIQDLTRRGTSKYIIQQQLERQGSLKDIPSAVDQVRFVEAVQESLRAETPPAPETANVATPAEAQPEAVGDGTVDGAQGMGTSGRAADITETPTGTEAPERGGLEPDMSVSGGPAVSERKQPAPLSTSELSPDPDKPSLPDTRGKGVRFHGSTSEITSVEDGYVGSDRNFYGQGFYTSDAVAITDGYSKAKGSKDGAVYRVDEVGPVKALDMEQPVPEWLIADYEAGQYVADKSYDLVIDAFEEMQAEGKTLNLREFFDLIRDISPRESIPTYEVQEYFDSLSQIIMARGFNALDHTGGLRTKKAPHSVRIYLTPQSTVRITKVDPKNPIAPTKAATEARTPARQLIPGTKTTVDPSTLQPIGKPRMERDEVYAPIKQGPAKVSRDIQEQAALADLVRAYVARTTPEYRTQTGTGGGINSKTKFTEVKEWTTLEDKLVVLGLLESTPTSPQEKAAKLYFSKTIRPSDALDMMIDDLTAAYQLYNNTIRSTGARSADPDFELKKDTGSGPAALALEWVRDGNLDDATVDRLNFKIALDAQATQNLKNWSKDDRVVEGRAADIRAKENTLIDSYLSGYFTPGSPDAMRAAELIEQRAVAAELARDEADLAKLARTKTKNTKAKAKKMAAADREVSSLKKELIRGNPLAALDQRLHYSIMAALERGDLRGALQALSVTTSNPQVAALATRFAALVPNTKVMLVDSGDVLLAFGGSRNPRGLYFSRAFGTSASGGSDPIMTKMSNTIVLNRDGGLNVHTLLHEVTHAATSHVLNTMPSHPFVKQMTELFEYTRSEFQRGLGKVEGTSTNPEDYHYGLTNVKEFVAELLGRISLGKDVNGMRALLESMPYPTVLVGAKDKKRNAWDKFRENFANFIRSLFGRPSVQLPQENALDLATRLADGLLALSPNVVASTALADASVSPFKARNMLNGAILNASVWDSAGREKLSDMMQASAPPEARRFLLGMLQLDWFNDLAGGYFKEIGELKVLDDLRRGDLGRLVDIAKPVHTDQKNYATKQPDMFITLASTQGRATLEEVDPTVPVSTYGADQDKVRVWHELNRELDRDATGEMRNQFKTIRNMMAAYRDEIKAVLVERVKDLTDDVAMQNQLVSRLMAKLDEGKAIDPYFSLMRKGDFWLSFTAEDTTAEPILVDPAMGTMKRPITQYVRAFESVWEREQFKVKLAAAKDADGNDAAWNVEEFMRPVTYVRGQTVPSAFVQGAINIVTGMVQPGATKAQQDQADAAISAIQDMFVRFTPENSIMKSFTQRKGTRGFIGDITMFGVVDTPLDIANALAEKTSSLAYQLANMKYGAKIQKLRNRATATERTLNESATLTAGEKAAMQAYRAEFDDRAAFAQSPNVSKNAQIARGVTFGMTLGFNIAGAANNLMQIIMVGIPELAGRYGSSAALRELGSASRLLMNAGKTYKVMSYGPDGKVLREISSVDNFGSLGNYYEVNEKGNYVLRTDKNIPAKLRAKLSNMDVLVEVLSVHGMLSNSMAQEMLETEAGWGQKINKWSGFLMHHGERYNRQAVAIAAYNLELGKVEGPISDEVKRAAAMKAVGITERVNGSIGAATAPRHALGSVGSVVFMFKRFGLHMARYIINTANQALRGKDPVERKIARYQITGILGTTALFAGVQGLPFFGELMSLINLIFTEDDEEPAEVLLQKYLQEPFYHGALNYLTGAEVASRISMSGLIFRENKIEKDQSILYDLVETLGGPAVGVFMNTERGIKLLSQGETYRGIEAMMPSVIKSAMKSVRYGTEGATTLRRDEVVPLTNGDIALQFLGYTPGAYARTQERVSGQKRIDEAVRSKRNSLLRKYYLAYLEGDFEEVRSVINETREFSLKHPEAQITGKTLSKSLNSNLQRSKEMVGGVSYTPNYRPRAVQELSEFDEDTSLWAS